MNKLALLIISLLTMASAAEQSYAEEEKSRSTSQLSVRTMYAPESPFLYDFFAIIREYELAIRDYAENDDDTRYELFHEKLKQITDADLLFMLVIFFDAPRWPQIPLPDELYECDSLATEVYLERAAFISLLNTRHRLVQEMCCEQLTTLSEQGSQKASNIITYVNAHIRRSLNVKEGKK